MNDHESGFAAENPHFTRADGHPFLYGLCRYQLFRPLAPFSGILMRSENDLTHPVSKTHTRYAHTPSTINVAAATLIVDGVWERVEIISPCVIKSPGATWPDQGVFIFSTRTRAALGVERQETSKNHRQERQEKCHDPDIQPTLATLASRRLKNPSDSGHAASNRVWEIQFLIMIRAPGAEISPAVHHREPHRKRLGRGNRAGWMDQTKAAP